MGEACEPLPVNLVCAVLAAREAWLEAAGLMLEERLGPVDLAGEVWPFDFTDYYAAEMGHPLLRRMFSFRNLVGPADLAEVKRATNGMEAEVARSLPEAPVRPVNLDPGYVDGARLVLATTKDCGHRIYIGSGIYAEVTLRWHKGSFVPCDWTYPDYRTERYRRFFGRVRALYRGKLRARTGGRGAGLDRFLKEADREADIADGEDAGVA